MALAFLSVIIGLGLLVWSAGHFVEGAAGIAHHLGMPPLLIGMVIVGFGTSAPEMAVSALAAAQGNPGLALGNAYGSNIANIALILGLTALISPIAVHSQVLRKELPILSVVTAIAIWQLWDGLLSRLDALALLIVFAGLMTWTIWVGIHKKTDTFGGEIESELEAHTISVRYAVTWLIVGLVLLIISSRLLVWGAVTLAQAFGISDLIIGLTIVAIGTSLPELASSLVAAHRGEHDIALGNVLGSNLFNTLVVVGIAGSIYPSAIAPGMLMRDVSIMAFLTLLLFVFGFRYRGAATINRLGAVLLLSIYFCYSGYLISTSFSA